MTKALRFPCDLAGQMFLILHPVPMAVEDSDSAAPRQFKADR